MPRVKLMRPRPKYLAETFRAYKKDSGITSTDIAKRLKCSPENVRTQLNTPAEKWNVGALLRVCEILQIPPEEAIRAAAQER